MNEKTMIKMLFICDDDELQGNALAKQIKALKPELMVQVFTDPKPMLQALEQAIAPPIIIMDILLKNGQDGIQSARAIHQKFPDSPVIFVSSFLEKACDVYEAEHCYFVYKPQMSEKLPLALEKGLQILENQPAKITFHDGQSTYRLRPDDILCIERTRRTTLITIKDSVLQVREDSAALESLLPSQFVRCHRNYYVNLARITNLKPGDLELENGLHVPVSRRLFGQVSDQFHDWLSSCGDSIV